MIDVAFTIAFYGFGIVCKTLAFPIVLLLFIKVLMHPGGNPIAVNYVVLVYYKGFGHPEISENL